MTQKRSKRTGLRFSVLVFLIALAARLLFWQATPDRDWPHSVRFKGDAIVWMDYAQALAADRAFELGLPLRPPANAYLLAALGVESGADVSGAKVVWCLLGALAVTFFFRAALAGFGLAIALVVAAWSSFSTALLTLSTSLNNETPYLFLVGLLLLTARRLVEKRSTGALLAWGGLNGLACLFRVEHLVFFVLGSLWVVFLHRNGSSSRARPRPLTWQAAVVLAAFGSAVLPWHVQAWRAIAEFNEEGVILDPAADAAQRAVEQATRDLLWSTEAEAERAKLPGFARRSATNFVAATVLVRGGSRIDASHFAILDQAFGYRPRPLAAHPFVALYGPLNFYLANREGAPPGFDVRGLDRLPPLEGGIGRYPRVLLGGLPPPDLSFFYPPHVELFNDGYRLGWATILAHPTDAARRVAARLDILWQGASMGWTGYGVPWGLEGPRRAVDLAVPEGRVFNAWRILLLVACAVGLWRLRRSRHLAPWLLLAATKVLATVFFFGYARHGAALVPVVTLLAGSALCRVGRLELVPVRKLLSVAGVVAAIALGTELAHWASPPALEIDGVSITRGDPHPLREHQDRRFTRGIE